MGEAPPRSAGLPVKASPTGISNCSDWQGRQMGAGFILFRGALSILSFHRRLPRDGLVIEAPPGHCAHPPRAFRPMQQTRLPRQRVLKGAKIIFNNGTSVLDCIARNVSDGGAALQLPDTGSVPAEFVLEIKGEPRRPCRVVWRREDRIGVRFT